MEKEIRLSSIDNLESTVYTLLAAKARGEHVYCIFNGHKLYSDTVTMDSAYLEVIGKTKTEYEREAKEWNEKMQKEDEERRIRESEYEKKVSEYNNQDTVITTQKVIDGLKFIAKNQSISQEELIDGLLKLGCNFTFEDINKQFPGNVNLFEGIKNGSIPCGANVIVNMRDSEFGREYGASAFLFNDDDKSIYHFIRLVTGDDTFTKENIEALSNGGKKL